MAALSLLSGSRSIKIIFNISSSFLLYNGTIKVQGDFFVPVQKGEANGLPTRVEI